MKGNNLKMEKSEKEQLMADDSLTFENLLAELRAVDNKDRTRVLIEAINNNQKELLQAVCKYSEKGSMTIKLDFGVEKKTNDLKIDVNIDIKKPKGSCSNMLFHNDKGDILLYDPNMITSTQKVQSIR